MQQTNSSKHDEQVLVLFAIVCFGFGVLFFGSKCTKSYQQTKWVKRFTESKVQYKTPSGEVVEEVVNDFVDFRWMTDTVYFNNKVMSTNDVLYKPGTEYWVEVTVDFFGNEINRK